jgi:hypothetical protein
MKQGSFAGKRGRWLATVRRGYPDIALRASGRDRDVSPRYYDGMAKVEYEAGPGHTVSLHVLHAGDGLRYERKSAPNLSSSYGSDTVWARWRGDAGGGVRGEAVVSWTRLTWNRNGSGRRFDFPFSLRDRRQLDLAALRNEWSYPVSERAILRAGLEAGTGEASYDYALAQQRPVISNGAQVMVSETSNATLVRDGDSLGAFVAAKVRPVTPLVIEPGIRFDRRDHVAGQQWSPRLNAALMLGGSTLRAAWGEYAQVQGLHDLAVADGERNFGRTERAEHRVLGLERSLSPRVALRVEAYERITTRVRPRWENLDNAYDLFPETQSDRVLLRPSRARARGVELLLASRGKGALQWHVSYALARSEELIAARWVPRARDQEHAFYADATYALNSRWQFSAAWQFHTGWPTTDVVYTLAPLSGNRRVLVSANAAAYALRLPDYHRLDLRATRRIAVKRGEVRLFLDVFNAYDRMNVLGYDHQVTVSGTQVTDRKKPREQLPFLPSVGATWEF